MIHLINCSPQDLSSYYSGCTLFTEDHTPVQVESVQSDKSLVVSTANGTIANMSYRDLFVQYLRPFYDTNGVVHGVEVARSYKRAPRYDKSVYTCLSQFSKGELPSTFNGTYGRVSYQFFVKPLNRKLPTALFYYDELVGFYNDGVFYVPDEYIHSRLQLILEGTSYVVQSIKI